MSGHRREWQQRHRGTICDGRYELRGLMEIRAEKRCGRMMGGIAAGRHVLAVRGAVRAMAASGLGMRESMEAGRRSNKEREQADEGDDASQREQEHRVGAGTHGPSINPSGQVERTAGPSTSAARAPPELRMTISIAA